MKLLFLTSILFMTMIQTHSSEPLIVAHRGASADAPENTIPAFELAWEQGADAIEGDFYLSKDGHIVCIHDKNTKKVAGKNRVVKDSTLKDLRRLDVGSFHSKKYKGAIIPTIAEVFSTIPDGKKIYIEVKCGKEIIPTLLKEIRASGLVDDQIVVISFDEEVIQEIKTKAPQFKANWLASFKKDGSGNITPKLETVLSTLKQINANGFSSNHKLITQSFIKSIRDQGFEYHVWTVDDVKTAKRLQQWGALSITTNVPGFLINQRP
ncbi:MAG: glycerophosphodiester phosphodiesterase [Verrucomicrobia bacterium]|nr:glycerophosphodiester phosphodiesterase [Verrucomicrobiota bacterium]